AYIASKETTVILTLLTFHDFSYIAIVAPKKNASPRKGYSHNGIENITSLFSDTLPINERETKTNSITMNAFPFFSRATATPVII
ncbi:hypothetical protein ACM5JM_004449, partial [Shigella flexneri]